MASIGRALDAIAEARGRTVGAGTTRVELRRDSTWELPEEGKNIQPSLVWRAAIAAGKQLLKQAKVDWRHTVAEGVLDLGQRRYMLDYRAFACLYAQGKEWSGRSGRPLVTLTPDSDELPTPLWLVDVLAGLTAAEEHGAEDVRGTSCRQFSATADVKRASDAVPGGIAVPAVGRFDDLLAMPLQICIDAENIRRIRSQSEYQVQTLDLWDFGVSVEDLDWTRLPSFRTPPEGAWRG